jgi:hypothetical protein
MRQKLVEHILSIIVVTGILLAVSFFAVQSSHEANNKSREDISEFADCTCIDFRDPFHKVLLLDVLNIYYPGRYDKNKAIADNMVMDKETAFDKSLQRAHLEEKLTAGKIAQLFGMYIKFFVVYIIVMVLTYYGVQTLGVWRFISKKEDGYRRRSLGAQKRGRLVSLLVASGKMVLYVILFSPAYVIAYSIRTEFNTDTVFFMVLLAVISNGLLVTYTNKFYTFLVTESRKGYVDTAVVKNLKNSYDRHAADGIPLKAILRPFKQFQGHVFDHIFQNARYQYIATIKEQSSFLITGLIIIEMALNIHGHLSYELLRQLLYKNYDIVILVILSVFYTVKITEITIDVMKYREMLKFENR